MNVYVLNNLICMEVNRPDIGVFKGMATQQSKYTHKRNYPSVDNKHQFDHEHPNPNKQMLSVTRKNFVAPQYVPYQKAKHVPNSSSIVLGEDKPALTTTVQQNFKPYLDTKKAELVKRKQTQLILGEDNPVYKSVAHDNHKAGELEPQKNISYKVTTQKYDTILGVPKTQQEFKRASGFDGFNPLKSKNYVANNFTRIPQQGQRFDIITGRRIPF